MARIDPARWRSMLDARSDLPPTPILDIWAEKGWPLIARLPMPGDPAAQLPFGLPLPPSKGRCRLRDSTHPDAIIEEGPPPLLAEAARDAPTSWQKSLVTLVAIDASVRCFGSLAWQHLTRLRYLAPTSDLDLLWLPGSAAEANALASRIALVDAAAPMRIDGEFIAPCGSAVSWREWYSSTSGELVVKARDRVSLCARAQFFQ